MNAPLPYPQLQEPAPRDAVTVRKEAVAWYARLCSGSTTDVEREGWRQWHDQHPDHQQAWLRIEAMRAALRQVPANIAAPALRMTAEARSRRHALRGFALLASTGTLGYVAWRGAGEQGFARPLLAQYRTGIGQQREVQLADGSRLILNTGSAVDVRFSGTERVVRLWAGEVLIETAHQRQQQGQEVVGAADARPFIVQTAQGSVTALGTRFTVRQFDGLTEVAVLEHAVALRVSGPQDNPVLLHAGQQARFSATRIGAPQPAADNAGQWQSGSLLVNDRSLAEVLAELSRYRHGRLGCDAAVARLRISGVFPLADTDRALALLTRTFPLRQRSITRYWVTLGPR
jgi:transmembrane sensor